VQLLGYPNDTWTAKDFRKIQHLINAALLNGVEGAEPFTST